MPTLPVEPGVREWPVWTTTARLVTTDPAIAGAAQRVVVEQLAAIDVAASRFRTDSEVSRLADAAGRPTRISPLLAELIAVALDAAADTDGAVDPTLGAQLVQLGYDRDIDAIDPRGPVAEPISVRRRADWRNIVLDDRTVTVPAGLLLDLGATAKAWAADRCAQLIVDRLGGGALVSLGGDLRVAGSDPDAGWAVLVQDGPDQPSSLIRLDGARAVATSSTLGRTWRRGTQVMHHILDPRIGRPAGRLWRSVSVAASSCVEANVRTTAAIVRGPEALPMLREVGLPARLVAGDGAVIALNGWPS